VVRASWLRWLLLLACLLLVGCGKPAFTLGARERFNLSPTDIRRLQLYTSGEIILRREVSAQESASSDKGLVIRDGTVVEEIVIPMRTPCVALRVEGDFILVGFSRESPARSLWFGIKSRTEDVTPHEERRFELVHLENALDEPPPFEPRYAKGYLLSYNGQQYQIADGKMWDVHLLYDEGSHIQKRVVETPPGWKQAP
jgi:hypothetical protein